MSRVDIDGAVIAMSSSPDRTAVRPATDDGWSQWRPPLHGTGCVPGACNQSGSFVRVDVKLAMETFAQIEKGHAVDMKKVSTTGTDTDRRPEHGDNQDDHPYADSGAHGTIGGRDGMDCPHGRYVDGDRGEKIPAAPANPGKSGSECGYIRGLAVIHTLFPLCLPLWEDKKTKAVFSRKTAFGRCGSG